MRSAVIILAFMAAVAAEAPYHLPRPAPHATPFGYPSGPAPQSRPSSHSPALYPQLPQPRPAPQPFVPFPHPAPAPHPAPSPQLPYTPNQGYNYQQPSFGPAFVHSVPQPAPQPISVYYPQQSGHLPAPRPLPLPVNYPQQFPTSPNTQPIPIPQPSYGLPQLRPQPQPLPQPYPHPQSQPLSNHIYNVPQGPASPEASHLISAYSQPQSYTYQQPISQPQFFAPIPLQSQPLTSNVVSSYQPDSNRYDTTQAQTHREALDETVVSRVQDIIKDSEHTSAKNSGYQSLVSGVLLGNAKPSIEISSFVHNSPLQGDAGLIDIRSSSSAASSVSSSLAGVSTSYDAPTVSAGGSQSSESSVSFGFLSSNKPGTTYGVPN